MKLRAIARDIGTGLVLMTAFAACTSGGSSTGMPAIVPAMAQRPVTAMGIVTIRIPPVAIAPRGGRGLTYVSSATRHAALFINGASAAAGSTTSCSSSSCTISWSLSLPVPAGYVFAVEIDSGSSGSPPNTVLAENAGEYLIHAGSNTLATLTLNGVAGSAALSAESCTARDCLGTLTIEDAAGSPITSPGSTFDNTQVAVGSSNTGTGVVKVPGTPITAVSSNGQYSYDVNCQIGTNTFALNVSSGTPSNDVTAVELAGLSPAVTYPSSSLPLTQNSSTYICRSGSTIAKAFFLTGGTSFSVPSDWVNGNNTVEAIAGGGGGSGNAANGGGGGGGGYALASNVTLSGTVAYAVGTTGAGGVGGNGGTGGNTYFCNSSANCASIAGTAVVVGATGGGGGKAATAGSGGAASKGGGFSGGAGGASPTNSATGAGGAAGPLGAGGAGGAGGTSATVAPGGGGNGGGSAGQGGTGVGAPAGLGGNNHAGAGGGSPPGGAGANGGGGGGGNGTTSAGGPGGNGTDWSSLFGGGGGGGAAAGPGGVGGNGGLYGAGGGAGDVSGGAGGTGLIVVIYTP